MVCMHLTIFVSWPNSKQTNESIGLSPNHHKEYSMVTIERVITSRWDGNKEVAL